MKKEQSVTRAQTDFLRAFARNPYGPPPQDWPSPVVLQRWLKRRGFCGAMNSILRALRYKADFHLTGAAASGAHMLHETVHSGDVHEVRKHIESLIHLLRMAHVRHRFAEPLPKPEPRTNDLVNILRRAHPDITVRTALECFDVLIRNPDGSPGTRGAAVIERAWPSQSRSARDEATDEDHGRDQSEPHEDARC